MCWPSKSSDVLELLKHLWTIALYTVKGAVYLPCAKMTSISSCRSLYRDYRSIIIHHSSLTRILYWIRASACTFHSTRYFGSNYQYVFLSSISSLHLLLVLPLFIFPFHDQSAYGSSVISPSYNISNVSLCNWFGCYKYPCVYWNIHLSKLYWCSFPFLSKRLGFYVQVPSFWTLGDDWQY